MTEVIAFLTSPSTGRRENPESEQVPSTPGFNAAHPEDIAIESESFSFALNHQFEQGLVQERDPELSDTALIQPIILPEQDLPQVSQQISTPTPPQISIENPFESSFLLFPEETAPAPATPSTQDGDTLAVAAEEVLTVETAFVGEGAETVIAVETVKADETNKAVLTPEGDDLLAESTPSDPLAVAPPVPTDTQAPEIKQAGNAPILPQTKSIGSARSTDPVDTPEVIAATPLRGEIKAEPVPHEILAAEPKVQFSAATQVTPGVTITPPVEAISQNDPTLLPPAIAEIANTRLVSEPMNSLPPPVLTGQAGPNPAQQIMVAIERLHVGDRISIRLDPPDLGNVSIRMEIVEGTITAIVAAERPDTVELLARHRSELGQLLSDAGFDDAETRVELQGKDTGREGKNLPGQDKDRLEERVLTLDEKREDLQNFPQASRNGVTDGRLDIRV